MAVRNIRRVQPTIWIPPAYTAVWKIVVTRSDGTEDDVTNLFSYVKVEDYVTNQIGSFELHIWDPNGTYMSAWTGNEVFKYYKDYAATATTIRFYGRIDKPSKRGHKLVVKGRGESLKYLNITVSKNYNDIETSMILKDLLTTYVSWATTTGVNSSTKSLTVNWYHKPFIDCVKELCVAAGFDFYIDASLDAQYFEKGSVVNSEEGVVHGNNLLEVKDFTPDLTQIRNRVIVYGATVDGVQEMYTAEQTSGEYGTETLGVREIIINDNNATTRQQLRDIGDYELANRLVPPEIGELKSFVLATISPGDSVRCSSPSDGIVPGNYRTTGYKDELNVADGRFSTTIYLNKKVQGISDVLRDRIEQENKAKDTNLNPYEMRQSYVFLFDEDSGSHSNTEISGGALKLQTGESSGIWVSPSRTLTTDLSETYLLLVGTSLENLTVKVSGNGGISWDTFPSNKSKITINNSPGITLVVRIEFNGSGPQIDSLSLMYKET